MAELVNAPASKADGPKGYEGSNPSGRTKICSSPETKLFRENPMKKIALFHKWKKVSTCIGVIYECKVCRLQTPKKSKRDGCSGKAFQ